MLYRKNEDDCDECDGNDDFCHPFCSSGPTITNPHAQSNWGNETEQEKKARFGVQIHKTFFMKDLRCVYKVVSCNKASSLDFYSSYY
jgi:hypothetical protein